jgi:hypothetical protein
MENKKIIKVEHVWHGPCDRWIYIEYYDNQPIGLNYCQGDDYEYFKKEYCKVDEGLSEFYAVMCEDYNIEKVSNTRIEFMSKVMWTYHTATILADEANSSSPCCKAKVTTYKSLKNS